MADAPLSIDAPTLDRVNQVVGVLGLLAGSVFLLGGGYFIHHNHLDEFIPLISESEVAEGTVVENRVYPSQSSRTLRYTSYQAIVSFPDHDGRSVVLDDPVAFNPPSFSVGQKVKVFYDPRNPRHAMIDRGRKNLVIPGICGLFGGLMVLGSVQRLYRPLPVSPQPTLPC